MLPKDIPDFPLNHTAMNSLSHYTFFLLRELCYIGHMPMPQQILTAMADACLINSFNEVFPILI